VGGDLGRFCEFCEYGWLRKRVGSRPWVAWEVFAAGGNAGGEDGPLEQHTRLQRNLLWQHPLSLPESERNSLDKMPQSSVAWGVDSETRPPQEHRRVGSR
jgi:hypothetical protein